ncbi:MAG: glycosyltransferase [Mariniphaga sp.]
MQLNECKKSVLVLLSTFNGDEYIEEQLCSLYRQKTENIHILIRDDGSLDSTVIKIKQYASKHDNTTVLIGDNVGCALSFCKLIEYAYSMMPIFDYYSFCDQDDVWDDDKLSYAITVLETYTRNPLRLYTSAYRVVDNILNFKYIQRYKYKHTLGESLIMINTMGCTQVFSRELLEQSLKRILVNESFSRDMPNHDGWLYLVAIVNKADIYYDETPHINYRQHGSNVMGAYQSSFINRFRRIIKCNNVKSHISKILFETYEDIDEQSKLLLYWNFTYKNSFYTKIKLLFSKEMMTNSISVNFAYRMLVLLNYY